MFRHQPLLKYIFNKELSEIYISIVLRDLALSMTGIFIPLFLFIDLKYPFYKVILFFAIYSLSLTFTNPLAAKLTSKYGIKHGILASMVGFTLYIILLATLGSHNMFYIPAIVFGVANSFYWVNFHADFARFSDKKHRGNEVSMWFIMAFLGALTGPILGSIIITYLGFTTLFIVASLLLLLSAVPLFFSSEVYEPIKFSLGDIFKKANMKETYFYLVYGIRIIVGQVALPIYVFFILKKYISLGAIASIIALGSMIVGFFAGKLSNEKKVNTTFRYSSLFHSFGWFFILFAKTFFQITIVNLYLAMSFILVDIPHHTMVYTKARKQKSLMGYIVYRETMIGLGRFVGTMILLTTGSLVVSFIVAGTGVLSWFFL